MSGNNSTWNPLDPLQGHGRRGSFYLFQTITFWFIFVLGIVGNVLVVLTILKVKQLRTMSSIFILNLSLCDIALVTSSIPPTLVEANLGHFPFGEVGCKLLWPLATFAFISGSFTLLFIAAERYLAIVHSFTHRRSKKHAVWALLVLHIISFASVIPYMADLDFETDGHGNFQCKETWEPEQRRIYTLFLFLIQYGVPLPIMSFFYTTAWRRLRDRNNETIRMVRHENSKLPSKGFVCRLPSSWTLRTLPHQLCTCQSKDTCAQDSVKETSYQEQLCNKRSQQTLKALRKFICVVVVFTVFTLPNQITWICMDFSSAERLNHKVKTVFYMLTYTNCVINPWIYGGLDSSFREAYKRLLSCKTEEIKHKYSPALSRRFSVHRRKQDLVASNTLNHASLLAHRAKSPALNDLS